MIELAESFLWYVDIVWQYLELVLTKEIWSVKISIVQLMSDGHPHILPLLAQ